MDSVRCPSCNSLIPVSSTKCRMCGTPLARSADDENALETVQSFTTAHEAEIARGLLETNEIPAWVQDSGVVGMNWTYSNAVGGVRLQVRRAQLDDARAILSTISEAPPAKGSWGTCVHCGSDVVEPHSTRRASFLSWLLLGFPVIRPKRYYRCLTCGAVSRETR